jgi:hypothetical protein
MALIFPILTQFDDKAAKKADKTFGALGKKFAALFSVAAVTKFTKASIKAFSEAEKEAAQLRATLEAVNLGFAAPLLNDYIDRLELLTGKTGGDLTRAFTTLSQATGDVTTAQNLLNLALDTSAATGKDLNTVAAALQRGYKGEVTALARLRIGYTTTQLKGKKFADVVEELQNKFEGAAADAADTFAGKMARLGQAFDQAQEKFGEGFVKALEEGNIEIEKLQEGIINLGEALGDLSGDLTNFSLDAIEAFNDIGQSAPVQGLLDVFEAITNAVGFVVTGEMGGGFAAGDARRAADERRKNEIAGRAALRQRNVLMREEKKIAALRKKTADDENKKEREKQALKRAGTVFDLENIQIVAALQGKISEDERLRLSALLAINNKNAEAAEKLSMAVLATNAAAFQSIGVIIQAGDNVDDVIRKLLNAQTNLALVKKGLVEIPKAKNPFEDWPDVMKTILEQIKQIGKAVKEVPSLSTNTTTAVGVIPAASSAASTAASLAGTVAGRDSGVIFSPSGTPFVVPSDVGAAAFDDPRMFVDAFSNVLSNPQLNWQAVGDTYVTNVTVTGSVTSDSDLVDMITNEIYKAQKSGKGILLNSVAI